jgi:D-serine deaminase-like pyridoxal phosphate-dependent protein
VSTVAEAEGFAAAGFLDLTYAVPVGPGKLDRLAHLATAVERLRLVVDHPAAVDAVEASARAHGLQLEVMLEIDCGDHRAGINPASEAAVAFARRIADSPHLRLAGLLTHAGQSYRSHNRESARRTAEVERAITVGLADRLRQAGLDPGTLSVGSTPTVLAAEHLEGIDEVRPGNYAFFDVFKATIGSCGVDDISLSVITEVISVDVARGQVIVDAGALALSVDPGPRHVDPDCGFGMPCDVGQRPLDGLRVVKLSQEHGVLRSDGRFDVVSLRPGDRLRILPNHSCLTAACHDRLFVTDGLSVVDRWNPVRGW